MYRAQSTFTVSPNSAMMMDKELMINTAKAKLNSSINDMLVIDKKTESNIHREFIEYQDITGGYEFTMIATEVDK